MKYWCCFFRFIFNYVHVCACGSGWSARRRPNHWSFRAGVTGSCEQPDTCPPVEQNRSFSIKAVYTLDRWASLQSPMFLIFSSLFVLTRIPNFVYHSLYLSRPRLWHSTQYYGHRERGKPHLSEGLMQAQSFMMTGPDVTPEYLVTRDHPRLAGIAQPTMMTLRISSQLWYQLSSQKIVLFLYDLSGVAVWPLPYPENPEDNIGT